MFRRVAVLVLLLGVAAGAAAQEPPPYLDVINVLDRDNVGYLEPYLEHDPDAERPRLLEKGTASIPFLPSIGVRFRF